MNKIKMIIFSSFFLLFFGMIPGFTSKAYSMDEIGDYTKIGQYDSKGYSQVGVSISVDGNIKYYVNDTWWKLGDSWDYIGTNVSGNRKMGPEIVTDGYSGFPIILYKAAIFRFQLNSKNILAAFPSDYSLVTRMFSLGQETAATTDYSFEDHTARQKEYYSIYSSSFVDISSVSGNGASFKYEVYTPFALGKTGKLEVKMPDGAELINEGKAYVSANGYYIDQFPQISYSKPGYTVEFAGWYDQQTGGNKIEEKSEISNGKKIYARFIEHVIPFKVTCYDILGTDISGKELGKTVLDAYEGDVVSGADIGSNKAEGAYYDGLIYHSCTEKTVSYDTTVYRFFTYPMYPVTYIDQISEGTERGKTLGTQILQKELNTQVSGEDLGTATGTGVYYQGYLYYGASSAVVSKEGTTVYRYFKPHTYHIIFHGNGNTGGSMESIENCTYGEEVTLPENAFEKKCVISLDPNGQNVVSDVSELNVSQHFSGWSLEPEGAVFCENHATISNLTDREGQVTLYAVWSTESKTMDIIPERKGYEFSGWSENPEDTDGSTQFTINSDITLYALWKKETAKYHLEYNLNDGTLANTETQPKKNFAEDEELTISNLPTVTKDGYDFVGWNTREDGSGVTIKSDSDLTKVFSEDNEASLYAVWKPSENTSFTLYLYKDSTKELLNTLVLKGTTDEKVSDALKKIYADTLGEDQVWQFYEGYEIINKEILEKIIQADGSTALNCFLTTRTCEVTLIGDSKDTTKNTSSEKLIYKDSYTLPKSLENGTITVDRYRDSDGKTFEAGEKIILEKNKTFYAQHLIRFYSDGKELKEKALYIDHGMNVMLPSLEKKGYQFLGWKEKDKETIHKENSLGDVSKGYELYAVWSEPNTYKISYEIEDHLVKIAENKISTYQFGKETMLPDKMQVIVESGYEFKGWYVKDDSKQILITKISAEQTGDITLKAKLVKSESTENQKEKNNSDQNKTTDEKSNDAKTDTSKQTDGKTSPTESRTTENKAAESAGNADGKQSAETDSSSDNVSAGEDADPAAQEDIKNPSIDSVKQNPNEENNKKNNVVFQVNGFKYQVISAKKKTVMLISGKIKKASQTISGKVRYQGVTYKVTAIGKKAFYGNKKVKTLVISSGIKKISISAFSKMKNLKKVTLGKHVTNIGKKAFYGNKKLSKVKVLSKKIKMVEKTAFKGIAKKAVFQLPAGKKKVYKKIFQK